jgi:signal transduction histidine kinase
MKNALSLILAVRDLLEYDASEVNRARLARLDRAVHRVAELISDDLHARPSKPSTSNTIVLVEHLLQEVVGRVCDRAARAGVDVVVKCGGGVIAGNDRELAEALVNLVSNAIDASPSGSAVVIATSELGDRGQELVIKDTGCGMTRDVLTHIGTPFCSYRAGGSGLGFPVARDVITRHGGHLKIESLPVVGTTLTIWLPAARCATLLDHAHV